MSNRPPTVIIENLSPLVDGGRYPLKRIAGEPLRVEADIFKDGHDIVSAVLKWRGAGEKTWTETRMEPIPWGNDRWRGEITVTGLGFGHYTVEAWGDLFLSWQHEFSAKHHAKEPNLATETLEGALLIAAAAERATGADKTALADFADRIRTAEPDEVDMIAHDPTLIALMWTHADRTLSTEFVTTAPTVTTLVEHKPLETLEPPKPAAKARAKAKVITITKATTKTPPKKSPTKKTAPAPTPEIPAPAYPRIWVDRAKAGFTAWYEFFPRSAEGREDRGSTFRDCLPRVDDAKAMGFDVIYFPPIHPIGYAARKGKNNSTTCQPGEPGVPYAIGNRHQDTPNGGGHKDIAPELGTLEDFDWLVAQVAARGMEIALDFALNCSPDHPYVHDHPDWFYRRPDGTIKYAENPPKKYQDVYPLNFHCDDWRALWDELTSIIEFWCQRGVRIFRVDNPHTKPLALWEYMIARVQTRWPDAIFLSEAFTKPKMMQALAKAGFTHSYTYFTWRNTKTGLTTYLQHLTQTDAAETMRANLWPNTPDILPSYLQFGGRPAFLIRAFLAATLSPIYGIYSGFELCENTGLARSDWNPAGDVPAFLALCDGDYKQLAREEYLDSEKYQFKARDWDAPGHIKTHITRLNHLRHTHRALQLYRNLRFLPITNDHLLAYAKTDGPDTLLAIVTLDAWHPQEAMLEVPLETLGLTDHETYQVHDLLTDDHYVWKGRTNYIRLDPQTRIAHLFRIQKITGV